jgi:hypothetical protein
MHSASISTVGASPEAGATETRPFPARGPVSAGAEVWLGVVEAASPKVETPEVETPGVEVPGDGGPRAMRTRRERRSIEGKPINQMEEKFYKEDSFADDLLARDFG